MIKEKYRKLVERFDSVMYDIGCEYLTLGTNHSEVYDKRKYYDVENGITIGWMYSEVCYWLSCYYKGGNCRCDDRFLNSEEYKIWVSETRKLKRLKARLEAFDGDECVEVEKNN